MSRDIVHAQRGFRRRFCGDFVNRSTEGEALPMDWDMVELRLIGKRNPGVARTKSCPAGRTISPPLAGTKSNLRSDGGREKFASRAREM